MNLTFHLPHLRPAQRSELTRNLEILRKGDVHTRLAAFEGRFGAPDRLADAPDRLADAPDRVAGAQPAEEAEKLIVRNAWP